MRDVFLEKKKKKMKKKEEEVPTHNQMAWDDREELNNELNGAIDKLSICNSF